MIPYFQSGVLPYVRFEMVHRSKIIESGVAKRASLLTNKLMRCSNMNYTIPLAHQYKSSSMRHDMGLRGLDSTITVALVSVSRSVYAGV